MKFTFPPESKPLDGYTIKRAIQRGGFGEVYYALSDGGKEVALKLLQQNLEIELRGVSQCLNLKHPNLVTIFDIRTDGDGDHWIVMEYVSGKSLDRVIQTYPEGMPVEEVQQWLSGICAGLSFLHDRGIVHRDLKPANIYREDGIVKIGDVGLAKFISQSRRDAQTQSVGTVYYMAPEVAHGRYGHEVDVYSLGCVLYELLTGRVPFDGESTGEILMKHLSEKPDLSPLAPRLRPVLARALEKDPLKRTPSVAQIQDEFRRAVLGEEIPSHIAEDSSFSPSRDIPSGNGDADDDRSATEGARYHHKRWHKQRKKAIKAAQKAAKKAAKEVRLTQEAIHKSRKRAPHAAAANHERTAKSRSSGPNFWAVLAIAVVLFLVVPQLMIPLLVAFLVYSVLYGIWGVERGWKDPSSFLAFLRQPPQAPPSVAMNSPPADSLEREVPASPIFDELGGGPPPVVAAPHPTPPPWRRPKRRRSDGWGPITPLTCRAIQLRHRMTEVTGSMVFAVLCTMILTAGVAILRPGMTSGEIGLFGITTLLASWGILFVAKMFEGTSASSAHRRLWQLLVGVVVGTSAFAVDGMLLVDFDRRDYDSNPLLVETVGDVSLVSDYDPTVVGYMLFFAGLFVIRRWWWHADAFRRYRFRLASVVLTGLAACVLAAVIGFPMVWAVTYAVAICSVVHLSAAWVPAKERPALLEVRDE